MDWDDLRVFLSVARVGTLSAAAKRLGVKHSTVGRRIAALENDLGVRLFHRDAAGYRPTSHGERLLPEAEAMEQAADAIDKVADRSARDAASRVRIAALPEYASHWIAPRLPAFHARHPQLAVHLVAGIGPLDLSRGEAELAVRTPRPRQLGLAAVRLAATATVALYSSKALCARRRMHVFDVASARGLPLCTYLPEHKALQSVSWLQPLLDAGPTALCTNDTLSLVAAARASVGLATLPRFVARQYPDLVQVSEEWTAGEMWLVTHPDFRRDPKVRVAAEFLKRAARDLI